MTIRTTPWPPGVPCYAELGVHDVPAAQEFYAAVLGWSFSDHPAEFGTGGHSLAHVRGHPAAAVGPLRAADLPQAWTLYLAADDAGQTAEAVAEAGGSVLLEPSDAGTAGRLFLAADPTGAVFGVWEAGGSPGASVVNEPGGLTWEDLRTPAPDAARGFYGDVFGYSYSAVPDAGPDYTLFALPSEADRPLGGMGGMMGMDQLPPHWLVYFGVADAASAVTATERHGGSVLVAALETPYGTMAGLMDPAGATFWVVQVPPGTV